MTDIDGHDWEEFNDEDTPSGVFFNFDSDVLFDQSDIDPIFIGQVDLSEGGGVFANVYAEPGESVNVDDIDFSALEELLGLVDEDTQNFRDLVEELTEELDLTADTIRGPFIDEDAARHFLDESGLWGVASIYYDDDNDLYYIDIDGTPL